MDVAAFVAKWAESSASERANAFLLELCDVLGVPRPDAATGDRERDLYVFERDAVMAHEGGKLTVGKIDLYKEGCFLLEAKQGSEAGDRRLGTARRNTPAWIDLQFVANKFGPYADRLRHLLDGLDGSYLDCERRLSDARPLDPIRFEDSKRSAVEAYLNRGPVLPYLLALEKTAEIIDGFESPLGMELLATVDWLLHEKKCEATVAGMRVGLEIWHGGKAAANRKLKLFDDRLLGLALTRLARA